jgi:Uma2 family endonuclease
MSVLDERDVTPRRWTRAEYDRMVEVGLLGEDDRVELIDGEILTMTPQDSLHSTAITLAHDALRVAFAGIGHVRGQCPIALDDMSEPEPDLAVVAGAVRDYTHEHPAAALLLVEVALTTLSYARRRKASLYARAGIPEYWVINLRERCLEVYRSPIPREEARYGFDYAAVERLDADRSVTPLLAPTAVIAVADLLP